MPNTATLDPSNTKIRKLTFDWTSDGSGAISITSSEVFTGYIVGLETVPGATTPTNGYNLELRNANGTDLLGGAGASRSASTKQIASAKDSGGNAVPIPVANSKLTLIGSGAGSSKTGTAIALVHML